MASILENNAAELCYDNNNRCGGKGMRKPAANIDDLHALLALGVHYVRLQSHIILV